MLNIYQSPNEITIFAVGPLTNVALLYKMYPNVSSKVKAIHIMGGNFMGVGNISMSAEFNFWFDPEAARIVLAESKCPLYVLPWEVCLKSGEETPYHPWRLGILNSVKSDIMNLMDRIEQNPPRKNFTPCDAYLIACYAFPNIITRIKHHMATVELSGEFARGLMVLDQRASGRKSKPNVYVIEDINVELFKKFLLWVCGHENSDVN